MVAGNRPGESQREKPNKLHLCVDLGCCFVQTAVRTPATHEDRGEEQTGVKKKGGKESAVDCGEGP